MIRADTPLTEEIIALILAYLADDLLDRSFIQSVAAVAAAIIEEEVKFQAQLLSLEYDIDPVALAKEWIAQMPSRISGITDTTAALVKDLLVESFNNRETISTVASRLSELFSGFDRKRSILIARTEVLGAMNFASFRAYQIARVPFKRWLATMDDRVRDSHAATHMQLRPTNKPFDVDGTPMMHPGDPSAPAKEVVNCRCTMVPEMTDRSIWTKERIRAIWIRSVRSAFQWEDHMQHAVRDEFHKQHSGVLSILQGHGI